MDNQRGPSILEIIVLAIFLIAIAAYVYIKSR